MWDPNVISHIKKYSNQLGEQMNRTKTDGEEEPEEEIRWSKKPGDRGSSNTQVTYSLLCKWWWKMENETRFWQDISNVHIPTTQNYH
jgi:hypothetical protein